jgi:hypothetical protein
VLPATHRCRIPTRGNGRKDPTKTKNGTNGVRGGSETGNIDRASAGEKGTNRSELKTVPFCCYELTKTITGTREPQRLGLIPSSTTRILGRLTERGTKSRETARHSIRRCMTKKKRKEKNQETNHESGTEANETSITERIETRGR